MMWRPLTARWRRNSSSMSYALIALVLLVACTLVYMALSLGRKGGIEVLRNAKEEWHFVLLDRKSVV